MSQNAPSYLGGGEYSIQDAASKYPNPFCDIASMYIPQNLNDAHAWCTPAGTPIQLDRYGRLEDVEHIAVNNIVMSDYCVPSKVDKVGNRTIQSTSNKKFFKIETAGLQAFMLTITPDHPVLVSDRPGGELKYVPAGEVKVGQYCVSPLPSYEPRQQNSWVSEWLCGAYVAEGNILYRDISSGGHVARGVRFTVGSHEKWFISRLEKELYEYGVDSVIIRVPSGRPDVTLVEATSPSLAQFFEREYGTSTEMRNKRIPEYLFHSTNESKLKFLAGLSDGDGELQASRYKDSVYPGLSISTVSRQLAYQCVLLAFSCGEKCSVSSRKRDRTGSTSYSRKTIEYIVNFSRRSVFSIMRFMAKSEPFLAENKNVRKLTDKDRDNGVFVVGVHIYRRVKKSESFDATLKVYNIRVTGTHNYVAGGIVVHNCEFLMLTMAPFMSVTKRVVSYFLTEINLDCDAGDDVIDKYDDLLNEKLHVMDKLQTVGIDYFTYGNSFTSLYYPFNRFLICKKCGLWYHCQVIDYTFDSSNTSFKCKCKKCGYEGEFEPRDMPDRGNLAGLKLIRWNPKRMHIKVNPISGQCRYEYDLEPEFVDRVRQGHKFFIDSTPLDVLEACAEDEQFKDSNVHRFVFNEGAIHHMKEAAPAGIRNMHAWGMPPLLPYFKLAYYIQLLRRYDEAIALDFIIPFRVLFPQYSGPQGQDALTTMSMQTFISAMQSMVAKKRMNIATYEVAPFPVGYQMIGGEAKQLAPKDNVQQALSELLSALGFPEELFSGNLTLQAAPVALRLFERQFNVLVDNFNVIIQWMLDGISAHYRWEPAKGKLSSITLADDIERKGMQLQAAAGMDVSKTTAFKALGLDWLEEQKRLAQETVEKNKIDQEVAEKQQAETDNGEGNAPGAGNNPAAAPGDMISYAQDLTQQLLQMSHTQRRQYLARVQQTNPTLHALLNQMLEEARRGMASQGQQMIMQQNNMPVN